MKKILMISYYYPPLADVGGLRALGFSRYLPELGWEPYVLSVKNPDRNSTIPGGDPVPEGVRAYYTRSVFHLSWITGKANGLLSRILKLFGIKLEHPLIKDLVCIPDEYIGWIPLTFLKGLRLIRKHRIDVIYVSCKPFSSSIIGMLLKLATRKPLVVDFRDPVSPDYALSGDPYYVKFPVFRLIARIEETVLRRADKLLLTTRETQEQYDSFFPFIKGRTAVIYNGFFDDLISSPGEPFQKFTIVYSGNFYNLLIPIDPFFKAMRQLTAAEPGLKGRIEFLYVGARERWLQAMIDRYELHDVVRVLGRVSREESIATMGRASLLLLRIVPGKITTKLFEGLAAGPPLLALINQGEAADIIREYALSSYYIVKPYSAAEIEAAIKDAYGKWTDGTLARGRNMKFHEDFDKRTLTARFASVIDSVLPYPADETKNKINGISRKAGTGAKENL
jgi:glycosyltransferase involved in cell wall biosynthesis